MFLYYGIAPLDIPSPAPYISLKLLKIKEVAMPVILTPDETQEVTQGFQQLIDGVQKQIDEVNKQPGSDAKTKVANALAAKLGLLKKGLGLMTPAGAAAGALQVPDLLLDILTQLKDNTSPQGLLGTLLATVLDILFNIVDMVISIIEDFVKRCVAIYEKHAGNAKVVKTDAQTYKLSGSTNSLRLQFGQALVKQGLPQDAGPYSGTWTATLVADGTDATGAPRYRATQYLCAMGSFSLGPAKLDGVEQVLDPEKVSTFTVGAEGKVNGVLSTRFKSTTWGADYPGIPGRTVVTGTVSGDDLTYEAEGWDFAWAAHLIPGLQQPAAAGAGPLVIHTDGTTEAYKPDQYVGYLVRSAVPPTTAELVNSAVVKAMPQTGTVKTAALRQVADLARTNPFEEPVRKIVAAPAAAPATKG
jgi:hypothetical protein